jgi:hypothetical protein
VRTSVVRLSLFVQPSVPASNPGFATSSGCDGGGGRRRGGGGEPLATAYDVLDTVSEDTSTASNAEPGTPRRRLRSPLFHVGSGTPLMNHAEPLSASTIPCAFSARRMTWFCAEKPLMSKLAFRRNHAPMGGSDAPPVEALWLRATRSCSSAVQ